MGDKIKVTRIILLILGLFLVCLLANYAPISLESTNNLMYRFIDPIFNFLELIASGIIEFFGNLLGYFFS
jgi:hypothetical protein